MKKLETFVTHITVNYISWESADTIIRDLETHGKMLIGESGIKSVKVRETRTTTITPDKDDVTREVSYAKSS